MSEVCFRDKKPEIPVPPRPQKLKDQGEVSSAQNINCTNSTPLTELPRQTQHSTTNVRRKSSNLPPERPPPPPVAVTKKDSPKVPPQRPAPPKVTLSAPTESSSPSRPPPVVLQTENSQPHPQPTDSSPHLPKEQSTQLNSAGGSVTPPKPRPRTFIDTSLKPHIPQRSASAYKPTENIIPPRPLPRKLSAVDSDASKISTVDPTAEVIPPPKPSRHQSFRNSSSPIQSRSRPCSSHPAESQEVSSESVPDTQSLPSTEVPAAESLPSSEVPAAESLPSTEVPAAESLPSTEVPAAESLPSSEVPAAESLSPTEVLDTQLWPSTEVSTTNEEILDANSPATEEDTSADKTEPDSSESTEIPESIKLENDSSSTEEPTPCPLPPKKNPLVISQPSFKCSSDEEAPVPSPRIKRPPKPDIPVKPDTPASTPINSNPASIVSEEPKDFILPSANDIIAPPSATVNKPTIIRASNSIDRTKDLDQTQTDSTEKHPNSSAKLSSEEITKNTHPKDPEVKRIHRPPPPIPKKNPISSNVCDSNVPNGNSTKRPPAIPKKPPKPCPPAVAQIPVKNKQNLPKEPEQKLDDSSSSSSVSSGSSSNLRFKNLIFSKKSSSPLSSSTDLKKSEKSEKSGKSRKASEMLQTTKDYTRRLTKSLGFASAEEPSTVWYTDKSEEPEEKPSSSEKKKENESPSIWYVEPEPEEETEAEKAPDPGKPDLQSEESKNLENDGTEKLKEMDHGLCQTKEEPSPTEISAFRRYHSYMKRTIEEAVGIIHLSKSTSSLMDDTVNETKEEGSDVLKPQPVKPAVPDPPKQRPPIPPKDSRPPKPSAPPQVKPNVPAVPPKRPPVPPPVTQSTTKSEPPAVRPPPPRPKPVVSVKPTVPNNQNIVSDSELNSKNVINSEKRTSSIENLIGKFEEELCKKSVPPPRPALPVNKAKTVSSNLTDNQQQQLPSEDKETTPSADTKTEITSVPSNLSDDSGIKADENENVADSATEVDEKTRVTENSETSNLTADSSIDENANEEADGEPGKDAKTLGNVDIESVIKETSVTEAKPVGYSDSFNQRCKSLMTDLKTHFESVEKDDTENKEMVEPGNMDKKDAGDKIGELNKSEGESIVVSPEKMQESSSNGETEEKVEPSSSEEKSSGHLSLGSDTTEVSVKTSQENLTSQVETKIGSDKKSSRISQEVTAFVEELNSKDAGTKEVSCTFEFTGPRATANFDFDAQAKDELTLKKDDKVKLLSWVDTSWLYGNCQGKTGIFPLAFVHIIEPLLQSPSDTSGNLEITDVSKQSAMGGDVNKLSSVNSTQVMEHTYQKLSEAMAGFAPVTEHTVISTKEEVSLGVAQEDELIDSEQLDGMNIPVGGEQTIAYALYDFDGEDGELTFKEGDAITILKWVNDDWLLGQKDELVGNLPANFVNFTGDSHDELDLVEADGPPEPKGPPPPLQPDVKTDQLLTYVAAQLEHVKRLKGFACARFDFDARDDDELSFKDGDRIEIVEFVNSDWIRGSLHKKEGIFPAAFVSVEEFSPDEEKCTTQTTKVRTLHEFTASASDELSFKAGAIITCNGEVPHLPGWSNGSYEGRTGIFPTDFVTQEGI